jgi:membrane associated rhomboid family serine protease
MLAGMSNGSEPVREVRMKLRCPATITLLAINAVIWLLQLWVEHAHPDSNVESYFALSLAGLLKGEVWQLLTFQFMHGSFWHIFFNSWAIFVFGRVVEIALGPRRMVKLYLLSGVAGGLAQMLVMWLSPTLFGDGFVIGASAGAYGLVAATAALFPDLSLFLLLFLVIPIRMKASTLLWLSVVLSVCGVVLPAFFAFLAVYVAPNMPELFGGIIKLGRLAVDELFGNFAHMAHLGGILAGFLLARQVVKGYRTSPIVDAGAKTSLKITPAPD